MKVVIALYVSAIVPSTSARSGVLPASCSAPGKMQSSPPTSSSRPASPTPTPAAPMTIPWGAFSPGVTLPTRVEPPSKLDPGPFEIHSKG